ncbi:MULTISPECIES: IS66-like element accessory protein TnpA [Pseudomonadaceae]|uniref:Transposase n=1 Tax=Halopseudomonas litoralis TaxID=797277 RepID=A0A1H1X7C7_9GAMM|nr:transposase [Pseudomonas sp. 5Ae-yellow]SDT05253.1 transposase [Halopseudomonas litoralis]
MSTVSVTKPCQKRRRHSREFKASIVTTCNEPGASVSRVALDNGLHANLVRRWISESRRTDNALTSIPAFLPVNLPAPSTVAVVFRRRPHHLTGCNAWCAYGS